MLYAARVSSLNLRSHSRLYVMKTFFEHSSLASLFMSFNIFSTSLSACCYPNGIAVTNSNLEPCLSDSSDPLHTICCATNRRTRPGGQDGRGLCIEASYPKESLDIYYEILYANMFQTVVMCTLSVCCLLSNSSHIIAFLFLAFIADCPSEILRLETQP
ncbi:hypothetical protein K469DRAFT_280756 [Zopfia rhizophila CBS 207.26]|uniref:Uncharacterized protein n=1 Tax=Zopfia rhizophila CBS 207.26 TaxID=1314779 RepID=A0A6A6ELA0_9PEZI|nr:hypothetical protein K469DRAFT_280756 [Zopfia rhizophila CBS 207.26]